MPYRLIKLSLLIALWACQMHYGFAVEHPAGHGAQRTANNSGQSCPKVGVRSIKPEPLSEVSAGTTFSAMVFGANRAEDISVSIKDAILPVNIVHKGDFYALSGQLPADIHNSAARITIKIKGKSPHCNEETGWLLKIID